MELLDLYDRLPPTEARVRSMPVEEPARKLEPVPLGELIADLQRGNDERAASFVKKAVAPAPASPQTVGILQTDYGPAMLLDQRAREQESREDEIRREMMRRQSGWSGQMTATAMSSFGLQPLTSSYSRYMAEINGRPYWRPY